MANTATSLSTALSGVYIPQIWAKKLVMELNPRLFLSYIANTDYDGEIKNAGDVVKIRKTPTVAVRDYTVRGELTVDDITGPAVVDLAIDKGKYFAFNVDDVEKAQSDIDYGSKAMEEAAKNLKEAIEADFITGIRTGAAAANMGDKAGAKSQSYNIGSTGSPLALTADNALDFVINCGSVLDEQNVPEEGRYMVIPPAVANRIKKSEIKEVYVTGDAKSSLRTGNIGRIDRFDIFVSNMIIPDADKLFPFFGHKSAVTFANQLVKNEVVSREKHFGKVHRGLCVYGYEVILPEAFGVGCVTLG
jgi:hypothetical protein